MQVDRERAALIDHIGACERILKTPLPLVYAIKIRRFIALFLLTLPFALLHRINGDWLVPFITMMVAYPLMSLDQIGIELQNPFSKANLSHLPSATFRQRSRRICSACCKRVQRRRAPTRRALPRGQSRISASGTEKAMVTTS